MKNDIIITPRDYAKRNYSNTMFEMGNMDNNEKNIYIER